MAPLSSQPVLLINLPPWLPFAPPVGLASIVAVTRAAGFATELLDVNAQLHADCPEYPESPEQLSWLWTMERHSAWLGEGFDRDLLPLLGERLEQAVKAALSYRPGLIGLTVAAPRQRVVQWFCKRLRDRGYRGTIVIGGPTTFIAAERRALLAGLAGLVDAVVIGEGELSFRELLDAWQEQRDLGTVAGVAVYDGNSWRSSTPRPPLDMDQLPLPDYSLFDLELYSEPTLCLEWGRGCVRRCSFCEVFPMWGRRRCKSPARIIDEMAELAGRYQRTSFTLADPAVNGDPQHFAQVLELLIERAAGWTWSANMIAHRSLDQPLAERLHAAGCIRAEIGVESGSPRVLRLMHKGASVADNERTLGALKAAGIESVVFLLVGYPGEREADFQATLDFLSRSRDSIDLVRSANALSLQEGTPVLAEVEQSGQVPARSLPLWHLRWHSGDSTPEVRQQRVSRIRRHLDQLGIPHELAGGEDELETEAALEDLVPEHVTLFGHHEQLHDRITGLDGSFSRVAEQLRRSGPTALAVGVSKYSFLHLDQLLAAAGKLCGTELETIEPFSPQPLITIAARFETYLAQTEHRLTAVGARLVLAEPELPVLLELLAELATKVPNQDLERALRIICEPEAAHPADHELEQLVASLGLAPFLERQLIAQRLA